MLLFAMNAVCGIVNAVACANNLWSSNYVASALNFVTAVWAICVAAQLFKEATK